MKDHKPMLRVVLALVLLANAAILALPAAMGQGLQLWEALAAAVMVVLGIAFGVAGLKGLRGAG